MIRTVAFLCPQPPVPCLCLVSRVFPRPYFSVLCLVSCVSRLVSCALHLCVVSCVLCLLDFLCVSCLASCVLSCLFEKKRWSKNYSIRVSWRFSLKRKALPPSTRSEYVQVVEKRHATTQQNKRPKYTTHGCVEINPKSV